VHSRPPTMPGRCDAGASLAIQFVDCPINKLLLVTRRGWFKLALTFMSVSNLIELAISLGLELWLAILLLRRKAQRHFPVFFFYILISAPITIARLATSNHYYAYFYTYWWSSIVFIVLGLAASHEVFHWVYEGFHRLRWFQLLYYGAIALVLLVTTINSMANPPFPADRLVSLILKIDIAVNFIQVAIVAVFSALLKPLFVPYRRYPFGIASGFGVSAMGALIGYLALSVFGTKVQRFTQYASAVAYILALVLWIMAFFRQEPEEKAWTPPMPPEEMLRIARGYLKVLRPGRKD